MTVATQTRNWQSRPVGQPAPPQGPPAAASLFPLRDYLLERWGGQNLSAGNMWNDRPIRGGTKPSSHRGAAFDWRYQDPGPGRRVMLNEVLPFLIDNSFELNVQQIHDYVGCTIWKAERAADANGGWKTQPKGSQMGQSWAAWLHIEAGEWGWNDGRDVLDRLGLAPVDECVPVTDLAAGLFGLYPLDTGKRELRRGSVGDQVRYLQAVIAHRAGGAIAIDGEFGPQTERRVRDVQGVFGLARDGVCGPRTWRVIDELAVR